MNAPPLAQMLEGAVAARLANWSVLEVSGPDAAAFVHGFCTNDIVRLAVGDACEAFFTDVKARVLAYATVGRVDEERFAIVLSSPEAPALGEHLDRYLIREQVELAPAPRETCFALLSGALAERLPADGVTSVAADAWGEGVRVIWGTAPAVDAIRAGAAQLDAAAVEQVRIARGAPRDQVDVDQRNLPQEVDRVEQTISFTKGCYLGQEPVARIDALGQVNWLLRRLAIDGPAPRAGAELRAKGADNAVGRVTSAVSIGDAAIGLAYVRRGCEAAGTRLTVEGVQAEVLGRPAAPTNAPGDS